jgi:glutaredoxin 3
MAEVEIYTTRTCPFCVRAKRLLDKKGVAYREIDVTANDALRQDMSRRAGGRHTVPQIFIGGTAIGGCDDLYELEADDALDPMLGSGA